MLNRRLLRIKAMQSIYAFKQNEESDFYLALEKMSEDFRFELNMIGKTEAPRMKVEEDIATQIFKNAVFPDETVEVNTSLLSDKSKEIANEVIHFYKTKRNNDYTHHKRKMVKEAESIYDRYLMFLRFFEEMVLLDKPTGIFASNKVISCLLRSTKLQRLIATKELKWDPVIAKRWHKLFYKEETILSELSTHERDFEGDRLRFRILVRDFLFKNEIVLSHFEEDDINWAENKSILKSMLINTIKSVEEGACEDAELFLLSRNWEEDRIFFQQLFELYLTEENYYEKLITEKTKTWSADRIAVIDKILMKLAICEMMNFPNIPVKVSINEYIDISKSYSTPKSGQYINGMLDEISKKLSDEGKLKKSGRGLIDNK
ncbi:transcription antitermination factor NusB [Chondrinema litorale]|uniref:transcription antitermination factor NusB n=1 Tax=Chondrinema litorale TaxID=2994555 RepID=UPI00254403DA|nr:transcription antitermination factor NusB [Chondrinema litorale]UZR95798.1 transcription antitermination factor NusB [Chondrinema litorale]